MSWSSGTYTVPLTFADIEAAGTGILSADQDTQHADIESGINNCLTKDGQNAATANLDLGGFQYTNAADGTTKTALATVYQAQAQVESYIASAGSANAYTFALSPAWTGYEAGQFFRAIPTASNTGASTGNVNSLGNKNIKLPSGNNPRRNQINSNTCHEFFYDGTNIILLNPARPFMGVCLAKQSNQSISNASATVLTFGVGSETFDTDSFHDESSNTSRITIPTGLTGLKAVFTANIAWAASNAGYRNLYLYKDGARVSTNGHFSTLNCEITTAGVVGTTYVSPPIVLTDAEYYELYVYQTSGGAINVLADSTFEMHVIYDY